MLSARAFALQRGIASMQQELHGICNGTAPVAGLTYAPGQAASSHAIPAMSSQTGGSPPTFGSSAGPAVLGPTQPATGSQTGYSIAMFISR